MYELASISVTSAKIKFAIYPNPSSSTISFSSKQKQTITITDFLGRVVKSFTINEGITAISLSEFTAGIYFVKNGDGEVVKLVKE